MGTQAAASTRTTAKPVTTPSPGVILQRQCACGQHTVGGGECHDCKKKKLGLHRRAMNSFSPRIAPRIVHSVLRSPGQPLKETTRSMMEARFNHDFRHVQIHTGSRAADSARAVNAAAYTVGRHVVFANQYDDAAPASRRLLQHEMVHIIQQSQVADEDIRAAEGSLEIGDQHDPLERQAEAQAEITGAADQISLGGGVTLRREIDNSSAHQADAGQGQYDGCPHQGDVANARADAMRKVDHAVDLLNDSNLQAAAPLLEAHFHVDVNSPDARDNIGRIRSQFARMSTALNSGIRIFCRSAPRSIAGTPAPTMPVDPACAGDDAHSTSCADGDATATVALCETALLEVPGPLVKTLIHEFAHVACNGNPSIMSGGPSGGETYYNGHRFPGGDRNVLNQADCYAWFAMEGADIAVAPPQGAQQSGRSHAGWWAVLGVAAALGIGGIAAHGLLVGAGLGAIIGVMGLAGVFD